MTTRLFPLAGILSMTTGKLLSRQHMDGIYDIANYMTGDNLFTHQLPRAGEACGPALLTQHPQLADVSPPEGASRDALLTWLDTAEAEYGTHLPVAPLTREQWQRQDPIEELCDKVGPEKVYVLPIDPPPPDAR